MRTLKLNNPDMALYMASMGKVFRVTAICKTDAEANSVIAADASQTVIAHDVNGLVYLASRYGQIAPSAILKDIAPRRGQ